MKSWEGMVRQLRAQTLDEQVSKPQLSQLQNVDNDSMYALELS